MRINVYSEELTTECKFVEKHVEETGKTYYGFRMFFKSHPDLHHTVEDDDRTAITFWFGSKEKAAIYFTGVSLLCCGLAPDQAQAVVEAIRDGSVFVK